MYLHYRVLFMSQEEDYLRGLFLEAPCLPSTFLCHTKEDKGQGVIWLVIG